MKLRGDHCPTAMQLLTSVRMVRRSTKGESGKGNPVTLRYSLAAHGTDSTSSSSLRAAALVATNRGADRGADLDARDRVSLRRFRTNRPVRHCAATLALTISGALRRVSEPHLAHECQQASVVTCDTLLAIAAFAIVCSADSTLPRES